MGAQLTRQQEAYSLSGDVVKIPRGHVVGHLHRHAVGFAIFSTSNLSQSSDAIRIGMKITKPSRSGRCSAWTPCPSFSLAAWHYQLLLSKKHFRIVGAIP
jgi:hypothetical protein